MLNFFKSKEKKLSEAIKKNDLIKVEEYLSKDVNPNNKNIDGVPFLIYAAIKGYLEIVNLLIKAGADVNIKDNKNNTPLIFAVIYGHSEIANLLIEAGADIKWKNKKGYSAIIESGRENRSEMLSLLIDNGANINDRNNKGWSALHFYCFYNNEKGILSLLNNKANTNLQNSEGHTALMISVIKEHHSIITLLLGYKAELETICKAGYTALHIAIINENSKSAEILLGNGSNFYHRHKDSGELLIDYAYSSNSQKLKNLVYKHLDLIKESLEDNIELIKEIITGKGSDAFMQMIKSKLLFYAVERDNTELIDLLTEYQAVQAFSSKKLKKKREIILEKAMQKGYVKLSIDLLNMFQKLHFFAINLAENGEIKEKEILEKIDKIRKQRDIEKTRFKDAKRNINEISTNDENQYQIIKTLKELCKAYSENNSIYKSMEPKAKEIGEMLNKKGGIREMRKVFSSVEGIRGSRTLEMLWNGIGDWRG